MIPNTKKTKHLLIGFAQKLNHCNETAMKIHIDGIRLGEAAGERLLGLVIDQNLSWNLQLDYLIKKSNSKICLPKRTKVYLTLACREMLYTALIKPILEYHCTVQGYARLDKDICDSNESPCSRECIEEKEKCDQRSNRGNYNCSLNCNGMDCKQGCDAERYSRESSNKECNQKCNGDAEGCIMSCNTSGCNQTCDAKVCLMTSSAPVDDTLKQECNGDALRCDAQCYAALKDIAALKDAI
ncbi:hypothetical protein AWC38_SpisGene18135 [Stylophora pistillata]|uniref:Uncharacterized protein n=1 Tax=Stylophora pistillata TaxID=50429 RepID=A0A2B4RMH0_STYPI|nr:hypothetical protein AWC38_SpisGene18135 [Stylophora pistillata]